MAINFPDSPNNGDSFTSNNKTWVFDGTVWNITSGTNSVADGAITTAKIDTGAVTQAKLTSGLSGITITTSSLVGTVITSPFTNQFAFFSDTNVLSRWNGTAWVSGVASAPTEAPTGLTLDSATTTTATISFAEGAAGGLPISNYQYALSTNGGSSYGSYNALTTPDATSPITIIGLTAGTAYYIKLKAVNAQGVSNVESSALSFSTADLPVEYLVIAGGGGGGGSTSGGGGAGGYRTNMVGATSGGGASPEASMLLNKATYEVTVGAGGVAGRSSDQGTVNNTNGANSVFNGITSLGGGYGASGRPSGSRAANSGGSGGGGGSYSGNDLSTMQPGAGTASQGYAGGAITTITGAYGGSGGGGAGAVGVANGGGVFGAGGAGLSSSITGSSVTRGGGGGSGGSAAGAGGDGGGGAGMSSGTATAGTVNTGGGGGGNGTYQGTSGGAGGSGVVIIRYLTADATGLTFTVGAGLTSATTTSGSYTVRTFTAGTGNLVIS